MIAPHLIRSSAPTSSMSKPSQNLHPFKRRSTLKRSIDETGSIDPPSSPSKRSKVMFDSNVEILSTDEDDDLDPLVVSEQVRRAIHRHLLHDDESYERVRSLFAIPVDNEDAPSSKHLKIHLQGMIANVSHLTRDSSSLVHTVLHSEWIGRDESYFTLFVKFLGNLAAAQSGYVNKIMQVLVDLLGPQKTRRVTNSAVVRQAKIHRRVFQAIRYLSQLVPTASGALADRVVTKLDFDFSKGDERMTFIKNFMELVKYVPELSSDILTNVLRQLIKLDTAVQAALDDEDADADAEDHILQFMWASQTLEIVNGHDILGENAMDEQDDDSTTTDESDSEDEAGLDAVAVRRKKLKEDVKQVDLIMDILFQYYEKLTTSTTLQTRHNTIEQLIAQFHNLILPTYRSRHPQFLIFRFAQSDPIIVDRFVTSCVAVLIDKQQPQVLRHAAAAYFSGFVGRGVRVSASVVQASIDLLCDQLNILRKNYEATCRGPDLKRFGDFYSIFQAIMYIFCFRWRDIGSTVDNSDGESDIVDDHDEAKQNYDFPELLRQTLHAAIYSPLNPLRVCTPAIVEQFARSLMVVQFMYIYPKIEENKRVRIAPSRHISYTETSVSRVERDLTWVGDNGMLAGHFPYDPYHLPISQHWIKDDYLPWQGLPGEVESDSDDDDDDGHEDEDDETGIDTDADDGTADSDSIY